MLTLHQTPRAWNAPNISPFCTKLETYLRMADIPYEIAPGNFPFQKAPKGKVPYILFEGRLLSDSSRIIALLKERLGDTVDAHLTEVQRDRGHLLQRMLEEGTYWALLHQRWVDDASFELLRRTVFDSALSAPLRWIAPDLIRRRILTALYMQGTSRQEPEVVLQTARRDLEVVSRLLGEGPYLFGERPSSFDAVLYGITSSIWKTPFGERFGPAPDNVAAHLERMHQRYFPEL